MMPIDVIKDALATRIVNYKHAAIFEEVKCNKCLLLHLDVFYSTIVIPAF